MVDSIKSDDSNDVYLNIPSAKNRNKVKINNEEVEMVEFIKKNDGEKVEVKEKKWRPNDRNAINFTGKDMR
jgi:murein endopeptidase